MRIRALLAVWSLSLLLLSDVPTAVARSGAFALPAPVRAKSAMVASQHELASEIGVAVMKRGGNAIDAAIAVGIALAVVYPEAGNIGGGGFMLIRRANGETFAIDYREMAPKAATRDLFVDSKGDLIKGEGGSTVGYRASGVPGTLAGFDLAFRKYGSGKVSWAELVRPARLIAQRGYILTRRLADLFKDYSETLSKYDDSRRIFLNDGKLFEEGDRLVQADLGRTLARIERLGAREFYTGQTAKMIAADMKANNGLITLEDLQNYRAAERKPLNGTYRGFQIISMPPPSSGGAVMLSTLNMLEAFGASDLEFGSAKKYHLLAEASRRAFADRAEFMGDPDFSAIPVAQLIDKNYARRRISSVDRKRASSSKDIGAGNIAERSESMDTTHYTVVDPAGTVVSNTYTINDLYGSRVTAKGTGVLLNDEMDDFSARPDTPNLFGLIQGQRNAVRASARPLSSMTPTIVLRKDGSVWFALGARGGPRIISAVTQTVINVIDHGMNLQAAIDAPRIHHQWLPDELRYEPFGMSPDTVAILRGYGHKFSTPGTVASATGIMIDEKGYRLGAIDSRSDGAAIGY